MHGGGGGVGRVLLLTLAAAVLPTARATVAIGQENLGCLFSPAVCLEEIEWCFDDYAFGKCVAHGVDADLLYRYELHRDALHLLQREMERLFSLGYRWTHLYTQCILQLKLQSIRDDDEYNDEVCAPFADQDLNSALKAFEGDEQNVSPNQVAHVKYTPSAANPHADFADEVYVPDYEASNEDVEGFPENVIRGQGDDYRSEETPMRKILFNRERGRGLNKRQQWYETTEPHAVGVYPIETYLDEEPAPEPPAPHFTKQYNTPDGFRLGIEAKDLAQALASELKTFTRSYNTPDSFRLGIETKDFNDGEDDNEEVLTAPMARQLAYETYLSGYPYDNTEEFINDQLPQDERFREFVEPLDEESLRNIADGNRESPLRMRSKTDEYADDILRMVYENGRRQSSPGGTSIFDDRRLVPEDRIRYEGAVEREVGLNGLKRERPAGLHRSEDRLTHDLEVLAGDDKDKEPNGRVYTEGGFVELRNKEPADGVRSELARDSTVTSGWGFKRKERLDVKKPGPDFPTNNYAFKTPKPTTVKTTAATVVVTEPWSDTDYDQLEFFNRSNLPKMEKNSRLLEAFKLKYPEAVGGKATQTVYMTFKEGLSSKDPEQVFETIANLTRMPYDYMDGWKIEGNVLSFVVVKGVTGLEAANAMYTVPKKIRRRLGLELVESSIFPPETHTILLGDKVKKGVGSPNGSPNLRKSSAASSDIDGPTGYIKFKEKLNWRDGVKVLRGAANLLNMDPNSFTHAKVDDNEITFKVDPSVSDVSLSEVAKNIDSIKDQLKTDLGVEVLETGSKDKKVTAVAEGEALAIHLTPAEQHRLWLISFLLCGVIAAAAIAGAAFFFVRRHTHTKDKLSGLKQPDAEASKDYQELCRARMASKAGEGKPETPVARMGSTSGEPKSPSSRSSTSSWSEEPAVSNMDISTGHMVLSYMEDHLKNKDRLEQEWIALCAYEAEPCEVTVATSEVNLKKNRYAEIVPYDHSRVLLNQLLNINGCDYINASTINDHDPRNAAYIATQGPMESTTADLWQMLWEQGSVVMVMLTRLSENGTAMCHRYWPEEGSHIYHIYEVHLVSEHIWCDDYLVRSFYLKNLKTGETRTVTQFHFLSWPENGVPLSTKALLEFRRKVNKSYRGRSCPIVVHCSDGVGRTGTYCLIDMVLNRMAKGAKEIDIAATLEHIRDQRPYMVKTKQQFEFVLMAVAEEVHAILKAMPATHSPPPVTKEKE